MFEVLVIIVFVSVLIWAPARHFSLKRARARANRIISGGEPATEDQLNEIITRLLATNNWIDKIKEQDSVRVDRLREMRKEMTRPHP